MNQEERKKRLVELAEKEAEQLKAACAAQREEPRGYIPSEKELKNVSNQDLIALTKVRKRSKRGRPPTVKGKIDGKTWDYKTRVMAVTTYLATGTYSAASSVTKVPEATIRSWRNTQWWDEMVFEIRQRKNDELDAALTSIIDKSMEVIADRLENGEYFYDTKTGEIKQVPTKMKDTAVVSAIAFDKRQLLRGDVTSRTETVTIDQRLQSLAKQFTGFATGKTIDSDYEEVSDEEDEETTSEQTEQKEIS